MPQETTHDLPSVQHGVAAVLIGLPAMKVPEMGLSTDDIGDAIAAQVTGGHPNPLWHLRTWCRE